MKFLILILALVAVASSAAIDTSLDKFWQEFKELHDKKYVSSEIETLRYVTIYWYFLIYFQKVFS